MWPSREWNGSWLYSPPTRAPHATRPCSARCSIPGVPRAFHTHRMRCPRCRSRSDSAPRVAASQCCGAGNATAGTASTRPWSSADRAHCRSSGTCRAYPAPGPCTVSSPRHPRPQPGLGVLLRCPRCRHCWRCCRLQCCHLTSPSPLFSHAGSSASGAVRGGRGARNKTLLYLPFFFFGHKKQWHRPSGVRKRAAERGREWPMLAAKIFKLVSDFVQLGKERAAAAATGAGTEPGFG